MDTPDEVMTVLRSHLDDLQSSYDHEQHGEGSGDVVDGEDLCKEGCDSGVDETGNDGDDGGISEYDCCSDTGKLVCRETSGSQPCSIALSPETTSLFPTQSLYPPPPPLFSLQTRWLALHIKQKRFSEISHHLLLLSKSRFNLPPTARNKPARENRLLEGARLTTLYTVRRLLSSRGLREEEGVTSLARRCSYPPRAFLGVM